METINNETYAAINKIKPNVFTGVVRNIYSGVVSECEHSHKSISIALRCAEKQMK